MLPISGVVWLRTYFAVRGCPSYGLVALLGTAWSCSGRMAAPQLPSCPTTTGLLHLEVRLRTSVLYRSELTRGGVQTGWLSYTAALPYLSSSEPPACNGCSKAWLQGCAARCFVPVVKGGEAAGMGALFLKDSPQKLLFEGKKPLKWLCHAVGILLTR